MREAPMLVVGLMSGTSLDGMDAALASIHGPGEVALLRFAHRAYAADERALIEEVLAGAGIAATARLHALLGDWACEAVDQVLTEAHERADHLGAIAFHGQTVWHEPPRVTWQIGDAARLAERFGVRVVHDFRARDVAAGGQGAPLVPLVDALCFAGGHPRILLNIGGMANATWLPVRGALEGVVAGDCGPGMAVVDALARRHDPALPFDRDGVVASRGRVHPAVLADLLADPFFAQPLPKSTGRERFGAAYAEALAARVPGADGVRTAVALTAESVIRFCREQLPPAGELIVSGGGAHHPVLMTALRDLGAACGLRIERFDDLFFPGDAKEAVAFAMLGWLTLHGQPGNLPQVTGAAGFRVLGSVVPA